MSGEPKTLTLEEALVLIARDTQYSLVAMPDEDSDEPVALSWVLLGAFDDFGPFTSWVQAAEYALGVPVVARDEAAELRAAAIEWAQADHAASDAHTAWLSEAAKGGASYTGGKAISRSQKRWAESLPSFHAWVKASAERHTAKERLEALARRLVGGENEK